LDQVRLPDLEVIKRFSIAVRSEHAPIEEVLAALRADLEKISGGKGKTRGDSPVSEVAARERRLPRATPKPKPKPKSPARRTGRR